MTYLEQKKKIEFLFKQYLNNRISPDELKLLLGYFEIDENEELLKELIAKELNDLDDTDSSPDTEPKTIVDQLFLNIQKNKKK